MGRWTWAVLGLVACGGGSSDDDDDGGGDASVALVFEVEGEASGASVDVLGAWTRNGASYSSFSNDDRWSSAIVLLEYTGADGACLDAAADALRDDDKPHETNWVRVLGPTGSTAAFTPCLVTGDTFAVAFDIYETREEVARVAITLLPVDREPELGAGELEGQLFEEDEGSTYAGTIPFLDDDGRTVDVLAIATRGGTPVDWAIDEDYVSPGGEVEFSVDLDVAFERVDDVMAFFRIGV